MNILQRIKALWHENPILRKIAKNFGYLFSSNIISSAISMLQGIFSVRLLGVAGFGTLGTITVFATTINKLTSFRMGELVIKFVGQFHENDEKEKAAAVFKLASLTEFVASIVAFALIWVLAPFGAEFFAKDASLAPWFIIYGLIILANMFSESSTGLLQFFDRFKNMAGVNILQSIVTLILIIVAWWLKTGLQGILIAYLVGKIIHAVGLAIAAQVAAVQVWGKRWWGARLKSIAPNRKELVRFAVSTNINSTLSLISRDSIILWLSYFSVPEQVGYFKLASALTNYIQIPMAPLPQATYPELARAVARKTWSEFKNILKQGSQIAGAYSIMVAMGLLVLGKFFIRIVYGAEMVPSYDSLIIMLLGIVFANIVFWARSALLSFGLADYATKVNILVTIVSVIGYILLLPSLGHIGAAIMLSVANILGNSLVVQKVFRMIKQAERETAFPAASS